MTRHALGRRQRRILTIMADCGGTWPPHWRIQNDDRRSFTTLAARGLITPTGHTYQLTRAHHAHH
jgi:hypothetical protein